MSDHIKVTPWPPFKRSGTVITQRSTNDSLTLSYSGAVTRTPISIAYASTLYTNNSGLINIVRSGAITGVATEVMSDINIKPTSVITEPGAGIFYYPLINIDMSAMSALGDNGAANISGIRIVGAQVPNANSSNMIDLDGSGTSTIQFTPQGSILIAASDILGQVLGINHSAGGSLGNAGTLDLTRSGSFTGIDTKVDSVIKITGSSQLTDPAAGTYSWVGQYFDLSSLSVVDVIGGNTNVGGIWIVMPRDADIASNVGVKIDMGESGTPITSGSAYGTIINGYFDDTAGSTQFAANVASIYSGGLATAGSSITGYISIVRNNAGDAAGTVMAGFSAAFVDAGGSGGAAGYVVNPGFDYGLLAPDGNLILGTISSSSTFYGVLVQGQEITTSAAGQYGLKITQTLNDGVPAGGDYAGLKLKLTGTNIAAWDQDIALIDAAIDDNGLWVGTDGSVSIYKADESADGMAGFSVTKDTATPAANDYIGYVGFSSQNDNVPQDEVVYSAIIAQIGLPTTGAETGKLMFGVQDSNSSDLNTPTPYITLDGTIANENVQFAKTLQFPLSGATAQTAIDINYANTTYVDDVGVIDYLRSGNLTGVANEDIRDLNIVANMTLTTPNAGVITYTAADIDLGSMTVVIDGTGQATINGLSITAPPSTDASVLKRAISTSGAGSLFILPATEEITINAASFQRTEAGSSFVVSAKSNFAASGGQEVNYTLGGDVSGNWALKAAVTGLTTGSSAGNFASAFLADLNGDNNDGAMTYVAFNAGDAAYNGGAAVMTALYVGAQFDHAVFATNGDIVFSEQSGSVVCQRTTNGAGFDLTLSAGDGVDSGATSRAGGNVILIPGAGKNGGAFGYVYVQPDTITSAAAHDYGLRIGLTLNDSTATIGNEICDLVYGFISQSNITGWPGGVNLLNLETDTGTGVLINNAASLTLTRVDAGDTGPSMSSYHDSSSPAAYDIIYKENIYAKDSGGNKTTFAENYYYSSVVTNGSEAAEIMYYAQVGGGLSSYLGVVGTTGLLYTGWRWSENQGTDIASASTITLANNGNTFELTGTTAVDLITKTGFRDGSKITLIANENVTINHGTATSGSDITILLSGAANFAMTANDSVTLVLSTTTAGGQAWREISRTAI